MADKTTFKEKSIIQFNFLSIYMYFRFYTPLANNLEAHYIHAHISLILVPDVNNIITLIMHYIQNNSTTSCVVLSRILTFFNFRFIVDSQAKPAISNSDKLFPWKVQSIIFCTLIVDFSII
jgi:hypothetical protein